MTDLHEERTLSFLPIMVATFKRDRLVKVEIDWSDSFNQDDDGNDEIVAADDRPWTHQVDDWINAHPILKHWSIE